MPNPINTLDGRPRHAINMTRHAQLAWQDGQPFSETFGDVYFSRDCGLDETRHVFLRHNQLAERFAALAPQQSFTIGETGFGTGLNFLCAWQCFRQHAPHEARLHFVSVEKYPLTPADLTRALALWPELAPFSGQLCARYSTLGPGWHRYLFDNGRVTLTLIVGDAVEALPKIDATIDAWFLDGFAPAKNPDMWSASLFDAMARFSSPGATFSTFTSAGAVRRGLQEAGFQVEKVPGFGNKREMCCGTLIAPTRAQPWQAPWFARPARIPEDQQTAIVIGGGIAGASTAYSLAIRGWSVTLIERHHELAREASGNPQGMLYARLSPQATPLTQLVLAGYLYTLGLLHHLLPQGEDTWRACGVLQMPGDKEEHERQQALVDSGMEAGIARMLDDEAASACAGIDLPRGGLYFPAGGWLRPAALIDAMCNHPNIRVKTGISALELDYSPELQHWLALGENGPIALGSTVVLAGSSDSAAFDCTAHLPLKRVRGQISYLPATTDSQALKCVVCQDGYIAPACEGMHSLGASFKFNAEHLELSPEEHRENLAMLQQFAPALYQALEADDLQVEALDGRAAYRCTSPDYLPLIGPVAAPQAMVEIYQALARDASLRLNTTAPWVPGLYVNTAHGSRGLITAPLSGEILAASITHEPSPLPKPMMDAIHPNRFLIRDLVRGKLI